MSSSASLVRPRGLLAGATLSIGCLLGLAHAALADEAGSVTVMIAVGGMNQPSRDLKLDGLGVDFASALNVEAGLRYPIGERTDFTFGIHVTEASSSPRAYEDAEFTLTNDFIGPGLRYYVARSSWRPFVQANVYWVSEMIELTQFGDRHWEVRDGVGIGIAIGAEPRVIRRFSIPVKLQCLLAKPAENVSSIGFNAGIAYAIRTAKR